MLGVQQAAALVGRAQLGIRDAGSVQLPARPTAIGLHGAHGGTGGPGEKLGRVRRPSRTPCESGWSRPPPSPQRYVVPGVVGSLLITLGSLGGLAAAELRGQQLAAGGGAARQHRPAAGDPKIAVFLGVALLLQSWLALGFGVMHSICATPAACGDAGGLVAAAAGELPALLARCVYSYRSAQGVLLVDGKDPIRPGSWPSGWFWHRRRPVVGRGVAAPTDPFVPGAGARWSTSPKANPLLGAYGGSASSR